MPANATAKPRSKAQERRDERDEQLAALRVMLPPGSRVYTIGTVCHAALALAMTALESEGANA